MTQLKPRYPLLLMLAVLLQATSILAQQEKIDQCRLTMIVPEIFTPVNLDEDYLTFVHKNDKTTIALSKALGDSNYGHFTAKSVASAQHYELLKDKEAYDLQFSTRERIGITFIVLKWYRKESETKDSFHMLAFSDDCNVIYRLELYADKEKELSAREEFIELLNSCRRKELPKDQD